MKKTAPIKFELKRRPDADILARSVRDVTMAAGDCAVILSETKNHVTALSVALNLREMITLLETQESAALLKADELCR